MYANVYICMYMYVRRKLQILGVIKIWHDFFKVIDDIPMLFYSITTISKMFCMIYTLPQVRK